MMIDARVSGDEYKQSMRRVVSPVAVVTSIESGRRNGLLAKAVCSVTADPPTLLICINRNATAEALIAASGLFGVNFLTHDQQEVARRFSTSKLDPELRFATGEWGRLVTGTPILVGATAAFDCVVDGHQNHGTHHVFFGRVVATATSAGLGLLYGDGAFSRPARLV